MQPVLEGIGTGLNTLLELGVFIDELSVANELAASDGDEGCARTGKREYRRAFRIENGTRGVEWKRRQIRALSRLERADLRIETGKRGSRARGQPMME